MAIQLSPLFGTTAYPDRMGDTFPELVSSGRLVQGYNVSGPLSLHTMAAVDRDLSDPTWRDAFHTALANDRRLQRGLFGLPSAESPARPSMDETFRTNQFTVTDIRQLSQTHVTRTSAESFDYGFALLKTSAALVYTIQLATEHHLAMATDSPAHFALLARTTERDGVRLENCFIDRAGY